MTRYKIEMFIETDADPSTLLSVATDLAAALADDLETYDSEATAFEELTCVSESRAPPPPGGRAGAQPEGRLSRRPRGRGRERGRVARRGQAARRTRAASRTR